MTHYLGDVSANEYYGQLLQYSLAHKISPGLREKMNLSNSAWTWNQIWDELADAYEKRRTTRRQKRKTRRHRETKSQRRKRKARR